MMFTEESLENVVIEYLKDIDYKYIHGSNLNRDNKEVLLLDRLEEFLININQDKSKKAAATVWLSKWKFLLDASSSSKNTDGPW